MTKPYTYRYVLNLNKYTYPYHNINILKTITYRIIFITENNIFKLQFNYQGSKIIAPKTYKTDYNKKISEIVLKTRIWHDSHFLRFNKIKQSD